MAAFTAADPPDRAASDNAASPRVLVKAGFTVVGTETSYAPARQAEIEETVLRLPWDHPYGVSSSKLCTVTAPPSAWLAKLNTPNR